MDIFFTIYIYIFIFIIVIIIILFYNSTLFSFTLFSLVSHLNTNLVILLFVLDQSKYNIQLRVKLSYIFVRAYLICMLSFSLYYCLYKSRVFLVSPLKWYIDNKNLPHYILFVRRKIKNNQKIVLITEKKKFQCC